jgi:(R)-2-hydroxyacyl-CoA dehydratese activating ATPase
MLNAGVDVGTRFLKICIAEDGELLGYACNEMGGDFRGLYKKVLAEALEGAGLKKGARIRPGSLKRIVATGYGAHLVKKASFSINDISCTARGVFAMDPGIRTVIDAGGLFLRIIEIDRNGFAGYSRVNEKCAAGSGRFLEMVSEAVEVPFESISDHALSSSSPFAVTNSCAVFAESDIISHVNAGRAAADILAGVIESIASKTVTLLESADAGDVIAVVGGLSRVRAYVDFLRKLSGRDMVTLPVDPRILAAYGAALIAPGKNAGR